jgi:hypothetical protein
MVSIPTVREEGSGIKRHTLFLLRTEVVGRGTASVSKASPQRFSAFCALDAALRRAAAGCSPLRRGLSELRLPRKAWFGRMHPHVVEARRAELEQYIRGAVVLAESVSSGDDASLPEEILPLLDRFLGIDGLHVSRSARAKSLYVGVQAGSALASVPWGGAQRGPEASAGGPCLGAAADVGAEGTATSDAAAAARRVRFLSAESEDAARVAAGSISVSSSSPPAAAGRGLPNGGDGRFLPEPEDTSPPTGNAAGAVQPAAPALPAVVGTSPERDAVVMALKRELTAARRDLRALRASGPGADPTATGISSASDRPTMPNTRSAPRAAHEALERMQMRLRETTEALDAARSTHAARLRAVESAYEERLAAAGRAAAAQAAGSVEAARAEQRGASRAAESRAAERAEIRRREAAEAHAAVLRAAKARHAAEARALRARAKKERRAKRAAQR